MLLNDTLFNSQEAGLAQQAMPSPYETIAPLPRMAFAVDGPMWLPEVDEPQMTFSMQVMDFISKVASGNLFNSSFVNPA